MGNQHIRKVPRFLRDDWLLRTPFILNEVEIPPVVYTRLRKLPGPRKKPATPPTSQEYSDEELEEVYEATLGKRTLTQYRPSS